MMEKKSKTSSAEGQALIKKLKRQIVSVAVSAGEGHIASAFSVLDMIFVLYDRVLCYDCANPCNENRDRFILSKGHASLALYAVLAEKGFFPYNELERFSKFDGILGGHPDCNKVPGIEASTGSLGHGMPMAVGMALGLRIRNTKRRIYVMVGDGECNEGSIWESALLAAHHRLENLTCIVDYNHSGDRALLLGDLAKKFAAFGWNASTVDGHDHEEFHRAVLQTTPDRPTVIVAETIKGAGCKLMENNPAWHHRIPDQEELQKILEELT